MAALFAGTHRHAAGGAVADAARLVDEDIVEVDEVHRLRRTVHLSDIARSQKLFDAQPTAGQLGRRHAQAQQRLAAVAEYRGR